ncbi:23S rRNA (guanosine(2251)-2'-O)-methyltransferase RlmB [Hoeflea sp. YIM 152468]|uniref:23S rRNA (guanosine(2251)-2'-O)-methyltransferase RlmB n=1 Tax=Hoeflea sp. YIM 152468 TaxID=3031759 RepID=UPI0023DB67C8|nr:23S rRNA (guanosine(2251)-2'-O)-methyltransferase RlmB [Hoeflea sp. YIM 152468]MDF1607049.1 23S rRNA (guanosine(2251)-2'-O)-methyltransferase RlmB [Hoeflea sp. YIM 152468]
MSKDDDAGEPGSNRDTHYAKLRRAHRDAKRDQQGLPPAQPRTRRELPARKGSLYAGRVAPETVYLYGLHTVRAALDNPARRIASLKATRNALTRLEIAEDAALPFALDLVTPQDIDLLLGDDAVHQGVLLQTAPLKPRPLSALGETNLLVILDQVTDPHNVGAIMRSAVAFGAGALITTQRHSPQESGVLAKAASGALELIDHIEVRNLATAIEEIKAQGFVTIGLDSAAPAPIEAGLSGERIALVLGAEGKGLRHKTRDTVDRLIRLDMPGAIKSLNVSNATAIALYAARQHLAGAERR